MGASCRHSRIRVGRIGLLVVFTEKTVSLFVWRFGVLDDRGHVRFVFHHGGGLYRRF